MELIDRILHKLHENRQNVIEGKVNCIPSPFKRFSLNYPGVQQGKYYLVSANSKVGKTQITNFLFLYNPLLYSYYHHDKVRVKIFYFNLEETAENITLRFMSYLLYIFDGIEIDTNQLNSIYENQPVDDSILNLLNTARYRDILNYYEQCVEFRSERHPTGINNAIKAYCKDHGTTHYKNQEIIDNFTGESQIIKAFDYYEPDDKYLYFIPIIDHISLLQLESGMSTKQCIDLLSNKYLVKLRNRYNISPIVVQQQAADMESLDRIKANKLRPTMNGLAESKSTGRDANIMLGLFSPYRHELPEYLGYDITKFKDTIRFLEVVINREGNSNSICPLYFLGQCNYFKELPLPNSTEVEKFYLKKPNIINLLLTKIKNLK